MVIVYRRKKVSVLPYRLALWLSVSVILGLLYLNSHPLKVENPDTTAPGTEITRELTADVIIVLDYEFIAASGATFEERDWSASWINTIEQEIGPVTIATPQSLSHTLLSQARIVIWTTSVSDQVSDSILNSLRQFVRAGNLLVLNMPQKSLRDAFAANGRAGERRGQRVTYAHLLEEPYHQQLKDMPLSTSYIGSTAPRTLSKTLMSIDGAPVIYALPVGEGTVVTIEFDVGEQLVALQQGKPESDFTLRRTQDTDQGWAKVEDLVLHERLKTSLVPYADLLERFIVYGLLQRYAPVAGLWAFPDGAQGAVILQHDDAILGDGASWMLEYEAQQQARSTNYIAMNAGMSSEGAERIHHLGGETGLLWRLNPSPDALFEPVGIGRLNPVIRPIEFASQYDDLSALVPGGAIRSTRIMGGWWTQNWSEAFQIMAQKTIRIDTSYGLPHTSGYAFGTGLSFLVFGDDGLPLGMREMPVVSSLDASQGPSLETLLQESFEGHKQAILTSITPASFAHRPDAELFSKWLEVFTLARHYEHHMTSVLQFESFQRSRRLSSIRSRVIEDMEIPGSAKDAAGRARVLRIQVEVNRRGMTLVVPEEFKGSSFLAVFRGARRVGDELIATEVPNEPASIIGYSLRHIPLDVGFTNIDVYYH